MKNRLRNGQAVRSLWRVWAFSMGAPSLILLLGLWMSPMWLPVTAFVLELVLYALIRSNRESALPTCYLMPFVMTRILFWSGIIMLAIYLLSAHGVLYYWFDLHNPEIPYIPAMVIGPVGAIVAGWATVRGHRIGFCVDCRMRFGSSAERGFLGAMFTQEGRYQVQFTCVLGIVLTLVCYTYFFISYINVNINSSDKFFFVWLPLIFYFVSLAYMAFRYFSLWNYYEQEITVNKVRRPDTTLLRYLILDRERIFLAEPDNALNPMSRGLDTPASVTLSRRQKVPMFEASNYFRQLVGSNTFRIRPMYESVDAGGDSNVLHYIVSMDNPETLEGGPLSGRWFTLSEIERLLNSGKLAPLLAAEIHRLYTITMAWKTYDRTGRRRFRIKNYRPTFRLRNIHDWDVDFNDPVWLYVSTNNQDRPFYRFKRFWRRIAYGNKD